MGQQEQKMRAAEFISEKWSQKYKSSINCARPRGFSQRAHCAGRKKNEDVAEGAMSDLDLDIQDEHWDGIVGYVINGLKTGISPGRMELYLYKWATQEMFDLDEELQGRGFGSLNELVDHIQEHGGKYVNPTFDLDGLFGDDLDENLRDWFGKGKGGGAGGGGWDRYNTQGERIGKCGDRKPGEGKPKCLSKSRAASLRASGGKSAIATAVRRKRDQDQNPNRSGAAQNVASRVKKS